MSKRSICIIGGGTAGLAAELGLRKAGLNGKIYERLEKWGPGVLGFILLENGLKALDQIGVGKKVRGQGQVLHEFVLMSETGKEIFKQSLGEAFGIKRNRFLEILRGEVPRKSIHTGAKFSNFEYSESGKAIAATFENGKKVEAGLFLGCDGFRSSVRKLLYPKYFFEKFRVREMIGFISIATLGSEIAQRVFTVYGFSKAYGLAGLRVGFILLPNLQVQEAMIDASRVRTTSAGVVSLSQIAATAALEKCGYWIDGFVKHLTILRNEGVERLNRIPRVTCEAPEGTYLLFPNIQEYGMSSQELTDYILEKGRVAVVPGASQWFGSRAEGHIRICFSTSLKIFREALDRIEKALKALN